MDQGRKIEITKHFIATIFQDQRYSVNRDENAEDKHFVKLWGYEDLFESSLTWL